MSQTGLRYSVPGSAAEDAAVFAALGKNAAARANEDPKYSREEMKLGLLP